MDKKSIDTIKAHIKPDEALINKAKNAALNSNKKIYQTQFRKLCLAACLVVIISVCVVLAYENFFSESQVQSAPFETSNAETEVQLLYSKLSDTSQPVDENLANFQSNFQTADVASFNESMLTESCAAIVEGEIISIRPKEYIIVSEYEKFGNSTLTEKIHTLIYEMRITKVRYGNIPQDQTIVIEDSMFFTDSIISLKVGHSYVLALCINNDEIQEPTGKLISGNLKRESTYSTLYPFHPQIEAVEGGYLFSNDWATLATDGAKSVTVDIELSEAGKYYQDKMMFLSKSDFEEKFKIITDSLG